MTDNQYATYYEIKGQTQAWYQAIQMVKDIQLPDRDRCPQTIFTGCGSTYYLSLAGAALYQELTGFPARGVPAGELLLNSKVNITSQNTLLFAISRSGTTTETLAAVKNFKSNQVGKIITVSNYQAALSGLGDTNIVITEGQEESVAQTRSFASMYMALVGLIVRMAGRDDLLDSLPGLIDVGNRLISEYEGYAQELGGNLSFDRFYFLGSGIHYGLACEVNLKMKEMTLTHSEPFHFLEFRHGPMSMVNENAVVIGLISDGNSSHEQAVLQEMKDLGATVVCLGESDADVIFKSGLPESIRGILNLPILQLMAYYRSLAKELNPDRPHNLEAVVKLEL